MRWWGRDRREIDAFRTRGYAPRRQSRARRSLRLVAFAAVVATFGVAGSAALASTLVVGSDLPPITLTDQHDAKATVGPEVRIVVLTRDMAAGDVVKDGFAGMDQAALDLRGAVYVADISGMPSLGASMFAIPKMRDRSYRPVLDRAGAAARAFPYAQGRPTGLFVGSGQGTRVGRPGDGDGRGAALRP